MDLLKPEVPVVKSSQLVVAKTNDKGLYPFIMI